MVISSTSAVDVSIHAVSPLLSVGSCAKAGTVTRVPASAAMIPVNPRRKPRRSIPAPLFFRSMTNPDAALHQACQLRRAGESCGISRSDDRSPLNRWAGRRDAPISWAGLARCGRLCRLLAAMHLGGQRSGEEAVDIAVEHAPCVAGFDLGAEVFHHLIGLQHVRPDLVAPADVALLRFLRCRDFLALAEFRL